MSELYDNNLLESGFYNKGVVKQIIAGEGVTITGTPDSPIISVGSVVADINFTDIKGTAATNQIPNLPASKITSGTFAIARIPTGTTASTVALGNHNHDINNLTGVPTGTTGQALGFGTGGELVAISLPETITLVSGNFLVGGATGNEQRKILPTDIGLTANNTVAVRNSSGNLQGQAMSSSAANSTIPVRTPTGQGKFAPAAAPDEAVVLSQLNTSLENKVDKEAGKGLSEDNFTTDEKLKLSGLESPKFKGQFLSFADLTSADVGEIGGYAYVDGGVGGTVDLYIWDAVNSLWEIVVGESTAETPASIKSKYESNPDTNAFTDDLKNKLEAFTANFTSALKTAYDNAVSWISVNGANLLNHLSNKSNPHEVTASQIGLGNVSNTSDANKPVSIATQTALDNKVNFPATNGHIPVRTSAGSQGSQQFTSTVVGNSIMFRDSNGRSHIAAPTENTHIANKAYADRVWTPDYSNMETTNRITTHGGTWTVPSGRSGWVKLYTRTYTGGVLDAPVFLINGKVMENIWHEATSGAGTARSGSRSGLFQVKGGDTVQVHGNLERSCYFIPGIWV